MKIQSPAILRAQALPPLNGVDTPDNEPTKQRYDNAM